MHFYVTYNYTTRFIIYPSMDDHCATWGHTLPWNSVKSLALS